MAACATITLQSSPGTIFNWDPITPALQEVSFTVRITRTDVQNSDNAQIIFVDSNSVLSPARIQTAAGPRYVILSGAKIISFPQATAVTSNNSLLVSWGNASQANFKDFTLKLQILANITPTDDFIGGITFLETLNFTSACLKGNTNSNGTDTAATSPVIASVAIPKLVSIITAAPATINFGGFTQTSQTAQVSVKSTSTLNVAVASTNGSQMVRSGAVTPFPANQSIPYTMTFGGTAITSSTPLSNQTRAGVGGSTYPLVLSVPAVPSGKLAGSYSDTVTLTISPGT